MIKQIWFVRNITRLFVSLAFSINLIISIYSILSAFALSVPLSVSTMFEQFGGLLFFPFIGWCFFLLFWGLEYYLKRARKNLLKHKSAVVKEDLPNNSKFKLSNTEENRLLFLSKFVTCSNVATSVTFAFYSLDTVSKAKNIASFGLFPVLICWVITCSYYITLIVKLYNSKGE